MMWYFPFDYVIVMVHHNSELFHPDLWHVFFLSYYGMFFYLTMACFYINMITHINQQSCHYSIIHYHDSLISIIIPSILDHIHYYYPIYYIYIVIGYDPIY